MIRFVLPLLLTGFLVSVAGAAAPPRDLIVSYPTAGAYLGQNATITITDFNHYDGLSRNKSIELLYPNGTRNLLTREFFEGPSERYCVRANTTLKVEPPMSQVGIYTVFWGIAYGTSADPSDAKPDFCGPPPFSFETWELNATFSVSERETIEVGTIGLSPTIATMLPTQPTGSVKLADVNSAGQVASTPHFGMAVGVVATLVSLQSLVV